MAHYNVLISLIWMELPSFSRYEPRRNILSDMRKVWIHRLLAFGVVVTSFCQSSVTKLHNLKLVAFRKV